MELRVRISEGGVGEGGWWTGIGGTNRFCVLRSLAFSVTGVELYFSVQPAEGCLMNGFNLNLLRVLSFPEIMVKKTAKENATPFLPISSFSPSWQGKKRNARN